MKIFNLRLLARGPLTKALLASFLGLLLTACEEKGPAEKFGEKVDNTVSNLSAKAKDAAEDAGNAIEDACEKAKEKAGADNKDC